MDVLLFQIKQQQTTVVVIGQGAFVLLEKVQHNFMPQLAQVPCDDEIVKIGGSSGILEMGGKSVISSGGYGWINPIKRDQLTFCLLSFSSIKSRSRLYSS